MTSNSSRRSGGFLRRMGSIMNRAAGAVSMRLHIAAANLWRDNYNPLRSLTIMRAVHLLEEGERGAYADLQWTYRFIEMQDATLGALVERRTSAIQELDWDIKTRSDIPEGKQAIAERQAAALKAAYNRITNLSAAFETLAMASFRGFARLEKVTNENGEIIELAPVDQWFWVRQGIYGEWKLNRNSRVGVTLGEDVPEPRFVSREVSRPINRVALIAFVRKALSQKDWDGFIEAYGIPAVFIVMPEEVPEDKEDEYLDMAEQVTGDARGVLPAGSEVQTVDNGARGVNPFKDHISYQDSQVVLRGTGGKLTMLTESGSGTLAGSAHTDTFQQIARAEAAEISEILRRCLDAEIIEQATPDEDAFAYFELAANEETEPAAIVKDLVFLEGAGLEVDSKWIEEKTGYPVVRRSALPAPEPHRILNRKGANGIEWKSFARETGTLGIPREIMPQIQSGNRAAMVNKLRSHGVDYEKLDLKPADMKPTQAEYSPQKVEKARGYDGPQRALLLSSDNHVVDGHHQWMKDLQDFPNTPIPVFRIKAPILHILGIISQMSSTGNDPMPIRNRAEDSDFAQLFGNSLAKAIGVESRFLAPLSDVVNGRLDAMADDGTIDDATFLQLVTDAAMEFPELINPGDAAALANELEAAMGTAALSGVRESLRDSNPENK